MSESKDRPFLLCLIRSRLKSTIHRNQMRDLAHSLRKFDGTWLLFLAYRTYYETWERFCEGTKCAEWSPMIDHRSVRMTPSNLPNQRIVTSMRNGCYIVLVALTAAGLSAFGSQVVVPFTDGTLVDGGGFGVFDGTADAADWSFNQSSYEGAITISRESNLPIEHRLVFEFNLTTVAMPPPVAARFRFKLRGAPRFPSEAAVVRVFGYPSDLVESLGDFSAGPAILLGEVTILPFQPETQFEVDVTDRVNQALSSTSKRIAIRLQLNPQTTSAQAFLDALDSDPTTKPSIVISNLIAGDFDHDGDLDLNDYAKLVSCLTGPGTGLEASCSTCDLNADSFVDLKDVQIFDERFSALGR